MSLELFALLIAAIEFVVGLPLLLAPVRSGRWMLRFVRDDTAYRLTGMLTVLLCASVLFHGVAITPDVSGAVRLLAWWGMVKGVLICWSAPFGEGLARWWFESTLRTRAAGLTGLTIGGLLVWALVVLRTPITG